MSERHFIYGHEVIWDVNRWLWKDTGEPAGKRYGGSERPCPQCGMKPLPSGYDPCLGRIVGCSGACCGHGKYVGYIQMGDTNVQLDRVQGWWSGARVVTIREDRNTE
jgi:hypothetical protein